MPNYLVVHLDCDGALLGHAHVNVVNKMEDVLDIQDLATAAGFYFEADLDEQLEWFPMEEPADFVRMPALIKYRPLMGTEEYLKNRGRICPNCCSGSTFFSPGEVTTEWGSIEQVVHCSHCQSVWNEQYKLTGYKMVDA